MSYVPGRVDGDSVNEEAGRNGTEHDEDVV